MLQAKIFEAKGTTLGGQVMNTARLAEAVTAFNANAHSGLVAFDDYPGPMEVNLDRVAATATLHMEGDSVIASIKVLDTPVGRIVSELVDNGIGIFVIPVTSAVPSKEGLKLLIRHLVIPVSPGSPIGYNTSPLQQVQAWVSGSEHWPMFELKEHKYNK